MKKTLLLALLFVGNYGFSQGYKQDINVELLTEIISKKQDEIRDRVIFNSIQQLSNTSKKSTYSTSINLLNIVLKEKNKETMKRRIMQEFSLYAITYGLTENYKKNIDKFEKIDFKYSKNHNFDGRKYNKLIEKLKKTDKDKKKNKIEAEISNLRIETKITNDSINTESFIFDYIYYNLNKNPDTFGLSKIIPTQNIERINFSFNKKNYKNVLNDSLIIISLDKYLLSVKKKIETITELSKFLNDLDLSNKNFNDIKPDNVQELLNILNDVINNLDKSVAQNNLIAKYYNLFTKYILFEEEWNKETKIYDKKLSIDVEAIILELENSLFAHRTYGIDKHFFGVQPFFSIGLNYSKFPFKSNTFISSNDTSSFNSLAWAGEKIGLKLIFFDRDYTRSHNPGETYLYKGRYNDVIDNGNLWEKPLIVKSYVSLYASGIIYNIANIKTEKQFNYPLIGSTFGVQFFNDMDVSFGYAIPISSSRNFNQTLKNGFFNLSFDIPIFEYIKAARKDK
jgi:hypothetical protein